MVRQITPEMEQYRFYLVSEKLYHYFWHTFADKIIEESKGKPEYIASLKYILKGSLKLLHPFMPFVTEEIWSKLPHKEKTPLIISAWPS